MLSPRPMLRSRAFTLRCCGLLSVAMVAGLTDPVCSVQAADLYDSPPIEYSTATPHNRIATLQQQLESGEITLDYEEPYGYLPALLKLLDIPPESQGLVFSKTSLQRNCISPRTPRALYFNEDTYVGYCRHGELVEIAVADQKLGTVFYSLDQKPQAKPIFIREVDRCTQCHETSRTEGVPGLLVRSLFVEDNGQPIFSGGSFNVDHRTPLENRWGGWYVTGTHGEQKHLGNLVIAGREAPVKVDNSAGHNQTELPERVSKSSCLTPHSDIVALMVLEHQLLVQNRITRANFSTRQALHSDAELRVALGEPAGSLRESTLRRIRSAGDALVEALLFYKEAPLSGPIAGTSGYAEVFASRARRDSQGRSLRDFDLTTRMFRYPCSYLIESETFCALPEEVRQYVWERLWAILIEGEQAKDYPWLTADDRQAIVEILRETHPDLPPSWRSPPPEQSPTSPAPSSP